MRRPSRPFSLASACVAVAATCAPACSSSTDSPSRPPARLAPLASPVVLTDGATLVPLHAVAAARTPESPEDPASRDAMVAAGWGATAPGPGEPPIDRAPDGAALPTPGSARTRLARFAHLCDFQTADDESPTRLARFDSGPPFEGAFRPQEGHECRIVNAVVRTVNRIHQDAPLDFVLLGGDNVDSAQQNELDWVLAILGGSDAPIACDSGAVDDPVPGGDNDGKDPFVPAGLDVPWYWVTGNHDVLVQGNIPTASDVDAVVGTKANGGTRDYREPGAPITTDEVPADPRRAVLSRDTMIARVAGHTGKAGPQGHGLGAYASQTKKAFYAVDLPGGALRLLALDTAAETGGSEGLLRRGDLEGFLVPELARAKADGKRVIVASHHASDTFSDGTGLGGSKQADAVPQAEFEQLLIANPHVVAHFAGHSHEHKVKFVGANGAGYWEVRTAAIADYPHQLRVIEIWDEGNGAVSVRSVAADYRTDDDRVATEGRTLGVLDWTTQWVTGAKTGTPADRNVALWLGPRPAAP